MTMTTAEKSARHRAKDVASYRERKAALARTDKHRETRRLYMIGWRERNREKHNAAARASRVRNKEARNAAQLERHYLKQYGITKAQKADMIAAQGGACLICEKPFTSSRSTHVDHCHETGRVRGILCHVCNTKLGWYEENERKIEEYLA